MKVRTDFVTNSSSSSFVTITINLKNEETAQCSFEDHDWDDYYMPDYWEGNPINEGSRKGCNDNNNVCSVAELLMRLLRCTDTEFYVEGDLPEDIDYPDELFPLFTEMYKDEAKAKEIYEEMCTKYAWFKDVYEEYDDDFPQWVKDTFLDNYYFGELIESTKNINSLSDITSVHVDYFVRNWGSCYEPWMKEDEEYYTDDDTAEKEVEFNYVFNREE